MQERILTWRRIRRGRGMGGGCDLGQECRRGAGVWVVTRGRGLGYKVWEEVVTWKRDVGGAVI